MLTDRMVQRLKPKPGRRLRVFDGRGDGLFLDVLPSGRKVWRVRLRVGGRYRIVTVGLYPTMSLQRARAKAVEIQGAKLEGRNPLLERSRTRTFEEVVRDWFREQMAHRAPSYRKSVEYRLHKHVLPYLGERPLAEVTREEIAAVLKRAVERDAVETARRLLLHIGQVFRYAEAHGIVDRDPTRGLTKALPARKVRHMPAPRRPEEVGELLRALEAFRGGLVVHAAVKLLPYTFARPGELRMMRWQDVDFQRREWRYTVSKVGREHIVPLSRQALEILEELKPLTGDSPYVFPSPRSRTQPLSPAAINAAYRRLGIDTKTELTGHGWRSVARTLLREELGYDREVIEHQLAHDVRGPLGEAYDRTQFLAVRHKMMQEWADYLDRLRFSLSSRLATGATPLHFVGAAR